MIGKTGDFISSFIRSGVSDAFYGRVEKGVPSRLFLVFILFWCFTAITPASGTADSITKIKLNVYPANSTIETDGTAILHAEFFGTKKRSFLERLFGKSESETVRLQSNDWKIELLTIDGGMLSKPFLFQPEEGSKEKGLTDLLNKGLGFLSSKDSVLFTAPSKPGNYRVRLTEGKISTEAMIRVIRGPKKTAAGTEIAIPANEDPYLGIVTRYAPFIAQETWFTPKADYIARFDYDGNWAGDDNWENLETGSLRAFVYYAVMETGTHWFLHYDFFHPRDYSDTCFAGTCHENDYEGIILAIRKDGSKFGRLELMETMAHNNVYSYSNELRIGKSIHDIDGPIKFYRETHPIIFVEAGGHGVFGSEMKDSLFDSSKMDFKRNTGVTYVYTNGMAENPKSANDRDIGYGLLPIEPTLWQIGSGETDGANSTFEDFFVYSPSGGRPLTSKKYIAESFKGRTASDNKARPFWGWYDRRTKNKNILGTGQWALDPAYSISVCFKWPKELPVETDYVFNPFLETSRP